jgi:hypothetical protein
VSLVDVQVNLDPMIETKEEKLCSVTYIFDNQHVHRHSTAAASRSVGVRVLSFDNECVCLSHVTGAEGVRRGGYRAALRSFWPQPSGSDSKESLSGVRGQIERKLSDLQTG